MTVRSKKRNNMCSTKRMVAALVMVALVGTGCATQRGSGVQLRGNQDVQSVTAQVDVLEIVDTKKEQGTWLNTVKTPFVWVKENPKKSLSGVAVGALGYFVYDEYIRSESSDSPPPTQPIEGITQSGNNNKVIVKDATSQVDVFQDGEGNVVEIDVYVGEE